MILSSLSVRRESESIVINPPESKFLTIWRQNSYLSHEVLEMHPSKLHQSLGV
jgi:hypothetical protein